MKNIFLFYSRYIRDFKHYSARPSKIIVDTYEIIPELIFILDLVNPRIIKINYYLR